jgi:hypothetical protein
MQESYSNLKHVLPDNTVPTEGIFLWETFKHYLPHWFVFCGVCLCLYAVLSWGMVFKRIMDQNIKYGYTQTQNGPPLSRRLRRDKK